MCLTMDLNELRSGRYPMWTLIILYSRSLDWRVSTVQELELRIRTRTTLIITLTHRQPHRLWHLMLMPDLILEVKLTIRQVMMFTLKK